MIAVKGALGTLCELPGPARRVVSLVPSETEALYLLGAGGRVVGRTDYCVAPEEALALPTVGGTKDASVEKVLALAPDLVLLNQEENTEGLYRALTARGVPVHLSFPKTVQDALGLFRALAALCGDPPEAAAVLSRVEASVREAEARRAERTPVRVFCPIWRDPWMTIRGDTFISDMLDLAGGANIFAERTRRYPLAADLGLAPALSPEKVGARDVRYPRVTLDEVVALRPEVVLLPDEPHPFSEADADVLRALNLPASRAGRIHRIEGRALSWYSPRLGDGLATLARWLHPS